MGEERPHPNCLTEQEIDVLARLGSLAPESSGALEHVKSCTHCQQRFDMRAHAAPMAVSNHTPAEVTVHSDELPERLGNYRILQQVGSGGMGEVYEAEQLEPIRRTVALKVIKRGMDSDRIVARFASERQALALMDHPSIAKVFEAGSTPSGRPYFVMEYVHGVPITTYCDRQTLTTRERIELFIQLCHGVQHAHHKAIIHRDLKPSNVLIATQDGKPVPKIIDFGVAKATAQKLTEQTMYTALGELIGTPEYMSPEQAEIAGQDIDTRADVYALGVILYELLVGVLPFGTDELRKAGFDGLRRIIREKDAQRPSTKLSMLGERARGLAAARNTAFEKLTGQLKGDLDWITLKAMEKDRTQRYASPNDLAADLERYLKHEPVLASPPSSIDRITKFARRHKVGVATAATISLLVFGFAITMAVQAGRLSRERDNVRREADHRKQVSDFLTQLFTSADPFQTGGQAVTLREILDRGASQIRELQNQPSVQSDLMMTMGGVYRDLGLLEPAAPLLEEALSLKQQLYGDGQETALAMAALGHLERMRDGIARSDSLFSDAIRILERDLGPEHPDLADVLHEAAVMRRVQDKLVEAESLYVRVLKIRGEHLGPTHPMVGKTLSDLGVVHYFAGRMDDAEARTREALAIHEAAVTKNDVWWGECLNNLGAFLRMRGEYDEAVTMLSRALEIQMRTLGSNHPNVARTLNHLGESYYKLGRYDEALQRKQDAYDIYASTVGVQHTATAEVMHSMAEIHRANGDLSEALDSCQRSRAVFESVLGPKHEQVVSSLLLQAEIQADQGHSFAADGSFQQALSTRVDVFGEKSTEVLEAMEVYAALLARTGRSAAADSTQKRLRHLRAQLAERGP